MGLYDVQMSLQGVQYLYFDESDVGHALKPPMISWNGTLSGEVKIEKTNVTLGFAPFMQAPEYSWVTIQAYSSNFFVRGLAVATSATRSTVFLTLDECQLNFTSSYLIYFTNSASVLAIPAMNYSVVEALTKDGLYDFTNGVITQFVSDGTNFTNVRFKSTDIYIDDSKFRDCSVLSTGDLVFHYSQYLISVSESQLIINSALGYHADIDDLNVLVDDIQAWRQPFQLGGFQTTPQAPYKDIKTNKVWISSDVYIESFTVRDLIGRVDSTLFIPTVAPPRNDDCDWDFGSVAVSSVQLNISQLSTFTYNVTQSDRGTLYPLASSEPLSAIIPGQYIKLDTSVPLVTGTWYPIFLNYTDQDTTFDPSSRVLLDRRLFQIEFQKQGNALYFRRYPLGLAPSAPGTDQCTTNNLPGFECIGGVWVAVGSIDTTSITIPSGNVVVLGNLTTLTPISFSGTNSNLNVTECLSTPGIEINLEGEKDPSKSLTKGSQVLITQGKGCSQSVNTLPISVKQSEKSCKKIKVEQDTQKSSPNTLAVFFTVDNSKCNVKWIIIGCCVGGALVIILIILIIIFTYNAKARHAIRPFSAPRPTAY